MARSLYICYFGVREPLVQTRVITYLRELAKGGHEVSLLTFEKAQSEQSRKGERGEKKRAGDAAELFDLERVGGERYRRLYARLLET